MNKIQAHYFQPKLLERIIFALEQKGIDLKKQQLGRRDIRGVDEFHVRGAEVSKELANQANLTGKTLLDIGCGIGGPCRMLADEFNCTVTGIDLNPEYIRTATELTRLVGLSDRVSFFQGNALELPFEKEAFEVVWTQHVQMNIKDKTQFYTEVKRVLKPGGSFIYYDIFKKGDGRLNYPLPWAGEASISFLMTNTYLETLLEDLNFKKVATQNQTQKGIAFFEKLFKTAHKGDTPKVGLHLLMGESTGPKLKNLLKGLKEGQLELESGVFVI